MDNSSQTNWFVAEGLNVANATHSFNVNCSAYNDNIAYTTVYFSYQNWNESVEYDDTVMETRSSTFKLIAFSNFTIGNASLIWNSSVYASTTDIVGDGEYNFSRTITIPVIASDVNISFWWNFTLSDGTLETTSSYNQSIQIMALDNCSTYTNRTLTFNMVNEDGLVDMNASMEVTFFIWEDVDVGKTFSFILRNNTHHDICLYPHNATFTANATIRYYEDGYDTRTYYLYHATLTNVSQNISLYLLNSSEASRIKFIVKDQYGYPKENVYLKFQRYFIDTNTYRTVAIGKTDSNGEVISYLIPYDVYYKVIMEIDGVVKKIVSPFLLTSTEVTLILDADEIIEFFKYYGKLAHSCRFNDATNNFLCTVTDTSGLMTRAYLRIDKLELNGSTTICEVNDTSVSMTLGCNMGNTNNSMFLYTLYADLNLDDTNKVLLEKDTVSFGMSPIDIPVFGLEGLLWSFIFVGTMGFLFIQQHPSILGLMIAAGLFTCTMIGFLPKDLGFSLIVTVIIISMIIAIRSEQV